MFRTCLLAAALLLTGCSEPKRDPLAIGSEVFLNMFGQWALRDSPPAGQERIAVTEGTKLRIVEWEGFREDSSYKYGKWRPEILRVLVLEGKHTGEILKIKANHVFFAP